MAMVDIMDALAHLSLADRSEIMSRLLQLEAAEEGRVPAVEEKQLLDRELEDYGMNPDAHSPWKEAEARLRRSQ